MLLVIRLNDNSSFQYDLLRLGDSGDEDDAFLELMSWLARKLFRRDKSFQDITFAAISHGETLNVRVSRDPGIWIREVAQLFLFTQNPETGVPEGAVLAYIQNQHWGQFDFDGLGFIEDNYLGEWEGDYEEMGREYADGAYSIPEGLDRYVNYEELGEDIMADDVLVSWNHQEFRFSE